MSKELARKENTEVSTNVVHMKQEVLNSDIPIPRLYLMQKTSEAVELDKAKIGDFIKSTTGEKVGDMKTPVMIVPLKITNEWNIEKHDGKRWQWVTRERRDATNEMLPWTYQEDNGDQMRRVKTLTVYALLVNDIAGQAERVKKALEAGELPEPVMPVAITFRSTSFPAGGKVAMFFKQVEDLAENHDKSAAPYKYQLPLTNIRDENENGSFQVMEVGKAKRLDEPYQAEAKKWFGILNDPRLNLGELKVDKDESEQAPMQTQPRQGRSQF